MKEISRILTNSGELELVRPLLHYKKDNLIKIIDLGEEWFNKTSLPIPLGVDLVNRKFDEATRKDLTDVFYIICFIFILILFVILVYKFVISGKKPEPTNLVAKPKSAFEYI